MRKQPTNHPEQPAEHIPTPDEVKTLFEQLVKGEKYKTIRQRRDGKGLYLWDITIPHGIGHAEYSYMRKGRYSEGQALSNVINMTFYDESGNPEGGWSVAKYIDGEWKIIP